MSTTMLMSSDDALGKGTLGEYGITIVKLQNPQTTCGQSCFLSCLQPELLVSQHVPYKNVLYCESLPLGEVELTYVEETSPGVTIHKNVLDIGAYAPDALPEIAPQILLLAYTQSRPRPRVLALLNRHGGQGNACTMYERQILPVLQAARVHHTCVETEYSGHAADIVREMDISAYDIVACCSGDGVPHEVINGLYARADREQALEQIAVTQLPCGLGNAMSLSSHGTNNPGLACVRMLKLSRTRVDAMAVTQGSTTKLSFLSQAYGTIADADIGTEHLRWMGPARFDFGVTQRLIAKNTYPCDLYVKYAVKDKDEVQRHYEKHRIMLPDASTVPEHELHCSMPALHEPVPYDWEQISPEITDSLNIFYVGKMPYVLSDAQFFPAALPADGCMDLVVTTAKTSFFKMARLLFSVESGNHVHSPEVLHAKISAYRLVPRIPAANHYISVDGENFPFEPLQVEVVSKALTVLLDEGAFVDTRFTNHGK